MSHRGVEISKQKGKVFVLSLLFASITFYELPHQCSLDKGRIFCKKVDVTEGKYFSLAAITGFKRDRFVQLSFLFPEALM